MGSFVLKGLLIGLLFGVPVGAVGAMTVQRTLTYGMKAGLLTGLGSSVADCLYACVGVFGLTLVSDFLLQHQNIINFVGGCLVWVIGIRMLQTKAGELQNIPDSARGIKLFVTSFAIGVTNPTAIFTFLFAFSWFGIDGQSGAAVCAVCWFN